MKTNIFNFKSGLMSLLLIAVMAIAVTSCSDKDKVGYGTPEITGVRLPDPTKADSLFAKAGQGTIIAIMGNNLSDIRKVYINDQEVSFNSTMNTDHSVIVTVPTEKNGFKLTAFNSDLKDEIRIVTSHGEATYSFKILAPGPQLQRIEAKYPRQTGDTLKLHGLNLVDIEKMYITDVSSAQLDTTVWTEVPGNKTDISNYFNITPLDQAHVLDSSTQSYVTNSLVGAIVPSNAPESGTLVIECAAGTTYMAFTKRPGQPVILSVSSDMPRIGETLIITGREFVQVESVEYGDVKLDDTQFTVSSSEDTIYVPFTEKPVEGSSLNLTVTTPGGTVTDVNNFYDYSTLLCNFDDDATGHNGTDNGWGPNASYVDDGTADGKYAYINVAKEYQQWWGTMIYFRKDWNGNSFPLSGNIPSTAPVEDLYLAMEVCDNGSSYNQPIEEGRFNGYIRYMIQPIGDAENQYDNFTWDSNVVDGCDYNKGIGANPDGPVLQDFNGKAYSDGRWYRHVVPLSKFACYAGQTYAGVVATGLNQFRIQSINQGTNPGMINLKVDNVRLIYIPSK